MTENQMIQEYQTKKNLLIRDELYERNKQMLERLTRSLVNRLFSDFVLEKEDFLSYTYFSFVKCLESFDTKQTRYTFKQALATTNKSMIVNYGMSQQTLGNRALNMACTLDDRLFQSGCILEEQVHDDLDQELEVNKINHFLEQYPKSIQKLFNLKAQGYQNKEIARMLRMDYKKVSNTFANICKRYKNCYI
ncbi:MAG: sigma-70 family RNA polymerase sigma factor [Mycoplasmataceae bacterium]|jgi:RNA polymerase sigma factor (sigma-70 family)|nr:sigma-70 family RNA polymerase sigma factor [Mycoplasmataceae bacterium]